MNKHKGYTLVELMIIFGILIIIIACFADPASYLIRNIRKSEVDAISQDFIVKTFFIMKKTLNQALQIQKIEKNKITLIGNKDELIEIERFPNGNGIRIQKNSGTISIPFNNGMIWGQFHQIGPFSFGNSIKMGKAVFPMVWRINK